MVIDRKAWTTAKAPPANIADATPNHGLAVAAVVIKPATAPTSIMPSTPKLSTPARSANNSPKAAYKSGVPAVMAAVRMAT